MQSPSKSPRRREQAAWRGGGSQRGRERVDKQAQKKGDKGNPSEGQYCHLPADLHTDCLGGVYSSLCAICRRYIAEAPGAAPPPSPAPPAPSPPPAPPPPPTLISSDPRSPARCLAHRMSSRRPRPVASAAARNPPPPPGFPTTPPPLLRSVVTTGPRQPGPRRPNLRPPPQPARGR